MRYTTMKSWKDYTDNPTNKWVIRGWPVQDRPDGMIHEEDCPILDFCEGDFKNVLNYAMTFASFKKWNRSSGRYTDAGRIQAFKDIIHAQFFTKEYGNEEIRFRKV
jgi:hypothetical protein